MFQLDAAGFALIGVMIGAFATYLLGHRKIQAEHIVKERTAWREKIRSAMAIVAEDPSRKNRTALWLALSLNTNPYDHHDRQIVELAKEVREVFDNAKFEVLVEEIALLLKHDWDRTKGELRWFDFPPRRWSPKELKNQ